MVPDAEAVDRTVGDTSHHDVQDAMGRVGHVPNGPARLYYRAVGEGLPIVILHGGPDFDHTYLLPELDGLAASAHLIYYDQRGRGRSADGVRPEDVNLESEMDDVEAIRRHFGLESMVLLGHSWGGLLAMEYATRHPDRVSHLILVNTAPASHNDWMDMRRSLTERRRPGDAEAMGAISSGTRFQEGDVAAEAEYYRLHFSLGLRQPEHLEKVVARLRGHFTAEGILTARAVEQRLYHQTCEVTSYDLTPGLQTLPAPTLVIHGDGDLIPLAAASNIVEAIPGARLSVMSGCGHFAYLEKPGEFIDVVTGFLTDD